MSDEPLTLKSFGDYAKEVDPPRLVTCSWTFMDGSIPISETETVPVEKFDPSKFGSHVSWEPSGQGPVVYIDTPYADETEIYVYPSTPEFMNMQVDFNRYLILLRNSS